MVHVSPFKDGGKNFIVRIQGLVWPYNLPETGP